MQEEDGGQEVERLPDRVRGARVRPRERREEDREAGRDHQRPEAALRPAPPGDQAADDVRQRDPVDEGGLNARVGELLAGQDQCD